MFDLIICGGTFDHLHEGHKSFLRYAFSHGKQVIIGVTSDTYVRFKKGKKILPFANRKKELEIFLQREGFFQRSRVVSIDNRFDETQLPNTTLTALLVSIETYAAGLEINKERIKNNLSELPLLVFPLVKNTKGEKISSSNIREGITNRQGIYFPDKTLFGKTFFPTDSIRDFLHRPFGKFLKGEIPDKYLSNPHSMVTVGDVITKRIHKMGVKQKLSVIDFSVERKRTNESLEDLGFTGAEEIYHLQNPPGQLSADIWNNLLQVISNLKKKANDIVIVDGEEDLLVIPLILMLPLQFTLFYGQPQLEKMEKGVVVIEINEKIKQQTYTLLKQFVAK